MRLRNSETERNIPDTKGNGLARYSTGIITPKFSIGKGVRNQRKIIF